MPLTPEQKSGLNVALNEASLLGLEVRSDGTVAAATFSVLTLPPEGPAPEDTRVQFQFAPVGRLVASLRLGRWDDANAQAVPFPLERLLEVVQEFGSQPIFGSEFFDVHEAVLAKMAGRHSLDFRGPSAGLTHSLNVFQTGPDKFLDVCLWFDKLRILRPPAMEPVSLDEFIAGGQRWWDGLNSGDPRTAGRGIAPLPPMVQFEGGTVLSQAEYMRLQEEAIKWFQKNPGKQLTQEEFLSLGKGSAPTKWWQFWK